ncbi:hypothetical protein RUND412_010434 [Rhizina undulata]
MEQISITVCGDGGTGKSSISLRLVRSKWTHEYDPTVQDSYSVTRNVDGREYHLALTDTAGQEEYRGLWAASNLAADAYLLVYDITSSDSLLALDYFNDLIEMDAEERLSAPGAVPHIKIVAGNKCDLANERQVSSAEGLAWARAHGCGFMETSAKNVVNVEETFELIVRRVVGAREAIEKGLSPHEIIQQTLGGSDAPGGGDAQNSTKPLTPEPEKGEEAGKEQTKTKKKRKFVCGSGGCCVVS